MTIKEWQLNVDNWINEIGVRYFDVLTNALLLSEEVGEFNSIIAREFGEQSFKHEKSPEKIQDQLKDEIGDIFFVLTCLSNQLDIDLTSCLSKNLEKKSARDKSRHKSNKKLKGK